MSLSFHLHTQIRYRNTSLYQAGSHMVGHSPAQELITFLIMSLHTFGRSSAPVEVWYTSSRFTPAPPSPPIAPSHPPVLHLTLVCLSLHLSTCLPRDPPHHPSHVADKRPRCCQGYRSHCVPGCQVTGRCGDDQVFWSTAAMPATPPPLDK